MRRVLVMGTLSVAAMLTPSPAQAVTLDIPAILASLTAAVLPKAPLANAPSAPEAPAPAPAPPVEAPQVPDISVSTAVPAAAVLPPLTGISPIPPIPVEEITRPVSIALSSSQIEVISTAYCLTGKTSSGKLAYEGAAAMNGVPFGSRFMVLDGTRAKEVFTVEDRIAGGSEFDIAYPGRCAEATQYGKRTIRISKVGADAL